MNQSETTNPYPVGTRVMVIKSAAPQIPVGACGTIVGAYAEYGSVHEEGAWWVYPIELDLHASASGKPFGAAHSCVIPLCSPDPIADPRAVDQPIPEAA